MTNSKQNKKKVTLKPEEFKALINSAKLGEEVELFKEIVDNLKLLKNNVNKSFLHFLNKKRVLELDNQEIEDIQLLQMFLEKIEKYEIT